MKKTLVDILPEAQERIIELIKQRDIFPQGLRISLRTKGCSGLSWNLEFIDEVNKYDELVDFGDFKVYIDPKAVLFILGSSINYMKTELEEGFVFENPNEKSKCGCGESFTV